MIQRRMSERIHSRCDATHLLRILCVEKEKLADNSIGDEVIHLVAQENNALTKKETERVTSFLPGNHRPARTRHGAHEKRIVI